MGNEGSPVKSSRIPEERQYRLRHSKIRFLRLATGFGSTKEYLEYSGKKGGCGNEDYLDKSADIKVQIEELLLSMVPRSLAEVCPDACKKERQQDEDATAAAELFVDN